jgi:hypothetical protein
MIMTKCVQQLRFGHLWQVQNFSHKVNSEFIVPSYEHSSKRGTTEWKTTTILPHQIIVRTLIF